MKKFSVGDTISFYDENGRRISTAFIRYVDRSGSLPRHYIYKYNPIVKMRVLDYNILPGYWTKERLKITRMVLIEKTWKIPEQWR